MAISPKTEYPTRIDNSDPAGYPEGKARNISAPSDGTGTPLEAKWLNDWFGFVQEAMDKAGLVPSGTPDKVGASQIYDALAATLGGAFGDVENPQSGDYSLLAGDYASNTNVVYIGSGGDTFTHLTSASLTANESYVFIEHRGTGILTVDFANATDTLGTLSLGRKTLSMSPGEKIRFVLTDTANVWNAS